MLAKTIALLFIFFSALVISLVGLFFQGEKRALKAKIGIFKKKRL